jgi:methionyl-tRNA formyltransferase
VNIVFFGSGEFGLPTLRALSTTHKITAVVTQPDRPAGRSRVMTPTPIGVWAAANLGDVPLLKPENVNEPSVLERVRAAPADAWVVIAFGQKLSPALLEGRFAVNLHASLLPRWRGAAPINHAILSGDEETGNSVITLADRMDAGLVLGQSRRKVLALLTAGDLHDKLADDGPALVMDVLKRHNAGTLSPVTQDESKVTLAGKFSKADSWVDFSDEAEHCRRRINGLNPWPGVAATVNGVEVKLLKALAETEPNGRPTYHSGSALPGEVIDRAQGLIACGEATVLRILEVQPPGKRPMAWHSFVMGHQVNPGDRLLCNSPS